MIRFATAVAVLLTASWLLLGNAGQVSAQDKTIEKVMSAIPEKATAVPKQARKVLIYSRTKGFRHGSIGIGTKAIAMMGDKTGAYSAVLTEDPSFFAPEKLKAFDAVYMLNTTGDCLAPDVKDKKDADQVKDAKALEELYKKSLVDFVSGGKGLMGSHSATDTYGGWKDYNMMMGGAFNGHPWTKKVPIKNVDPKSPLNAAFKGMDFEVVDEMYQFRADTALASERRYLLVLDTDKMDPKDVKAGNGKHDGVYPVSWVSTYGKGRTFYCSLGHSDHIYWNPTVLAHYLAGLQYVLGDLPADATPLATKSETK